MADWSQVQEYNPVVLSTISRGALGDEIAAGGLGPASAAWPAANRAIAIPFVVYTPLIVVKMLIVNGSVASGNLDLGIYDDQQHLLVAKGSTAQAGTSAVQALDIADTTLQPGRYYMACAMDGTTGTVMSMANAIPLCRAFGVLSQSTAFPLADATWVAAQDAYIPYIGITTRTVA